MPVITLKITDQQKDRWGAQANTVGLSLSEWIRQRCDQPNIVIPTTANPGIHIAATTVDRRPFKGPDPKPGSKKDK